MSLNYFKDNKYSSDNKSSYSQVIVDKKLKKKNPCPKINTQTGKARCYRSICGLNTTNQKPLWKSWWPVSCRLKFHKTLRQPGCVHSTSILNPFIFKFADLSQNQQCFNFFQDNFMILLFSSKIPCLLPQLEISLLPLMSKFHCCTVGRYH